jgi:hypothetical protein
MHSRKSLDRSGNTTQVTGNEDDLMNWLLTYQTLPAPMSCKDIDGVVCALAAGAGEETRL